ncbi:MAG: VWA domain-containing protein [Candidatus Acidiferrales bacterium]
MPPFVRIALTWIVAVFISVALCAQEPEKKPKLPKPVPLDSGVTLRRDPASGEMRMLEKGPQPIDSESAEPAAPRAFRVSANLVTVNCNVFAPDGSSVAGLTSDDFRVYEDDLEQRLAYFSAGTDPASVALVIDASPSVLPEENAMQIAARGLADTLATRDEISIVEFSAHSYVLLPFTRDRALLQTAIAHIDIRSLFGDTGGSNIYETVYFTAEKLFRGRAGRKAILLLTDGQDSGLGLSLDRPASLVAPAAGPQKLAFDDVTRALAADGIEVYAVSTQNRPRVMTDAWLSAHADKSFLNEATRELGIPAYTLFLAELVRRAGGGLYFLRETQSGRDAFERIAGNIRTQYTLGFYQPAADAVRPGWHSLRVEVADRGSRGPLRVVNRAEYYVPAAKPQ